MKAISLLLGLWPLWSFAKVTFELNPKEIGINETIQFSITIEGDMDKTQPQFENNLNTGDFKLANPYPGRSQSTSIINGVVSSSVTFTYVLRPNKKGRLRFPPQTVIHQGRRYRSQPAMVEVGEEVRNLGNRRSRSPFNDLFPSRRRRSNENAELFAVMEAPKKEYYLGEPIPLNIQIYRTPGVQITSQGSSMELPDFKDFWTEDEKENSPERIKVRNGRRYAVLTVSKKRLYPNKTGNLVIPPAEFELNVSDGGFFADWRRISRKTDPLEITVKPLPTEGRPAEFSGLVGSFRLTGSLDKEEIKVGDSISLKLDVVGQGNFSTIW